MRKALLMLALSLVGSACHADHTQSEGPHDSGEDADGSTGPETPAGFTWTDLGSETNIASNNPCVPNDFDGISFAFHDVCPAIVDAWGGGAWDDTRKLLYLSGGGHDVSIDDSVLALDPVQRTITRLWGPASDVSPTTPQPQETPTTGQPVSVHVYSGMLYFPKSQRLWRYGGNDYGGSAQYGFVFEMDVTNPSAGWKAIASPSEAMGTVAGVYCVVDPTTADETAICTFPYGSYDFARWDRQTSTWTTLCRDCVVTTDSAGNTVPGAAAIGAAVFDPTTKHVWYFSGAGSGSAGHVFRYDASSSSSMPVDVTPQTSGCETIVGSGSYAFPGADWDPTVNEIRVYGGAGNVVTTFDPDALTCTDQTIAGGPSRDGGELATNNGIGSRFRYAASLDRFVVMPSGSLDGYTLSLRAPADR